MNKTSKRASVRRIEIMDTTLRDGEQAEGISMMPEEKRTIARRLLETVKVDRIEVASARVSEGERHAVKAIIDYVESKGMTDRVEILGFVDVNRSIDWARSVGVCVINLLTKGSLHHCREQLKKTHQQHLDDIRRTIDYGVKQGVGFNVYLEDWSGGMLAGEDYVFEHIAALAANNIRRIMLPDTLGLLSPPQVRDMVGRVIKAFPDLRFDFHGHDDYGLATANTLEAVMAGVHGVHVTVNGMGERAGNTTLDEVVVALRDHAQVRTGVDERALAGISKLVEVFSGRRVPANKPISGENVFTQTAGIHADGDMKGNLYESRLTPARFGRHRTYAMGKLMGKASLDFNLERLNITLTPEQKQQLLARIIELGDQKKSVTTSDLPFLISEVLQTRELRVFEVKDYSVVSNRGLRPTATILVRYRDKELHATGSGDGGYDAFMQALKSIEKHLGFELPKLLDYEVRIPPGGKTDALVETTIKWEGGIKTRGVHSDQLAAAIQATEHALNMIALRSTPAPIAKPIAKHGRTHGSTDHKKIAHARRG
ncbi:MAG TPA: alpha-isopropylmalate synthase regulatory domain-containing protein [Vicinamibacterales bacterium]|jgi:D-citramalate synthase|nr:alpha-isopropylmalate synthase regulatory domain-containing protein [Vicinamibacterales bacterium]